MPNYTVSFRAMGSQIQVWLNVDDERDAAILQQVPACFEAWEATLSRFRLGSELNQLNARAGEWVMVSRVLFDAIQVALEAAEMTGGLVTPLILPALEAAGYDHSFDAAEFSPGASRPLTAIPAWREIELDHGKSRVRLPAGARIDLGGTAKGWAAQQTADWLSHSGPCLVDAGGDLVARGSPDGSGGWQVSVLGTGDREDTLLLVNAAIAMSGTDYRRWTRDGKAFHHLIDPRTGSPTDSDIVTATACAPDAVQAEAWAKATLIGGSLPGLPARVVRRDGSVSQNPGFESLLLGTG
jgi:FAD:protein FMN transferase